ncbi:hypothetical protein N7450_008459 [Penicillium hetheringtonii]|uniref:Uncharacterized protein n=1 Tax=Penicillium hetheringtonii TaxID=911720 RepID=A0AAD6GMH0_9EURO|nr:hypothetical protein N7450_008459 [Penicillium hetheringtonii]
MTTSFADGKIYESIVDEYEHYITGSAIQNNATNVGKSRCLESRLQLLGCSSHFAQLVCPHKPSSHVLDRDFTLGALAFLCSRLLSASKSARAATVLQREWRAHIDRRNALRRAKAHTLAVECAAAVRARNELIWASQVITRWWRNIKVREQRKRLRYTQ